MAELSDVHLRTQAEKMVRNAINVDENSKRKNANNIAQIINVINSYPNTIPVFISIICKYLNNDQTNVSLNCLILIDALFKNAKKTQLSLLQSTLLIKQLSSPIVQQNPDLHNFLFKSAPSWVTACSNQNCLEQRFSVWQQSTCRQYYVPKMTKAIKLKLHNDLQASLEVLTMFTQCLSTVITDSGTSDDLILYEILPNVREINRRLTELEPTIVDKKTRAMIESEKSFCEVCQNAFFDYKQKKSVDINSLILSLSKAENQIQKNISKPKDEKKQNKEKKREPIRKRGEPFDEMPVEEFFKLLDELKKTMKVNQDETVNSQPIESNLIDINVQNEPQNNQPQNDDLIDSLLQI